ASATLHRMCALSPHVCPSLPFFVSPTPPVMNIAELILGKGRDSDNAIWFRKLRVTYAELREKVTGVASGLLAHGGGEGDRGGIFSENNPFFVAAYLGIIRAGLTAVPFQVDVSADTFADIVASTGMKKLLVSDRFRDRVGPWAQELGLELWTERDGLDPSERHTAKFPEIAAERDLAALMFTSGSTGTPKGVMVSHRNIECNTLDIISYMGLHA